MAASKRLNGTLGESASVDLRLEACAFGKERETTRRFELVLVPHWLPLPFYFGKDSIELRSADSTNATEPNEDIR